MVKSGLKKKEGMMDQTPKVNPFRLAIHSGIAYFIYGICVWNGFMILRKPQENKITLKNLFAHNMLRKRMLMFTHLLTFVFLTGYLVAGNDAGKACNTFPKLGDSWFPTSAHLNKDFSFYENLT